MAHDEAGVPVEAAASLFGAGDDPAIDFFSSSFNQDNLQEQSTSSHDLGVATTLFEAGPDESTTSFPKTVSRDQWLSNASSMLDREFNPEATPDIPLDSQTSYDAPTHQRHEWQDQHGQRDLYDNQSQYTSTYDYASQNQSTDFYAPHNEYHSQTVGRTMDHSTSYSASQHTTYAASQQQLDYASSQTNYTTQQPSSQSEYAPQSYSYDPTLSSTQNATYPQSVYNPYMTGVQPNGSLSTVDSGAQATEPSQSPKDVNAYRPTTLNAYDPPIPSKTRSKIRPAFYATQAPSATPNGAHYPYTGAPQPSSSLPPPPTTTSVRGVDVPTPMSYPVTAKSSSTSESLHDGNSSGWTHGTDGAHDASLSSHRSEPSDVFESLSTDHMDNSVSSQSNPQYVNAERELYDVESMSSSYGHNPEEDISIPTGNLVASTFEARPTQHRLKQPLTGDQLSISSTDIERPSFSPPPLTGSPVEYSQTPQPTAGTGLQNGVANDFADNGLPYDPYAPAHYSRQDSDASHTGSTYSNARASSSMPADPYAPPKPSILPRKDSTASSIHTSYGHGSFVGVADTYQGSYVPTTGSQRVQSRQSQHSYDDEYTSRYNYTHDPNLGVADGRPNATADVGDVGYSNVLAAPTYAPYAPSPSLLGTNDPLGRASARVPVISFGFGGKLVTCFHSAGETASGFDVSLTSRHSTSVQLRILHEVIPASAMDSSASSYPGPLFSDPGAPSISLARTVGVGTANNVKAKRALVTTWLAEHSEELSRGVAHIPSGSQERHNAEGKLVLVRLLKAMVDNDGQLSGSAATEWAVRTALVPRLESQGPASSTELLSTEHTIPSYAPVLADPNEPSLAVYHLRPSALDRIQEFLVRGERHQAYHYALDERLWAHAMLIASSVDTQAWREVVNEFLHSELSMKSPRPLPGSNAEGTVSVTNGRESLRVAYSLFAGQGAAAVQELIPPKVVPAPKDSLLAAPTGLHTTPISPNFPQPALTSMVPPESLAKWQETAAVMAFSQTTGDSAALTALGDYLAANRWFEAAHACYLLSPRTSSLGGVGIPSVRIVLVGCESPSTLRNFNKDLDVTIFSEIVEFALSLSPPKGQDMFGGLPHLQAYKLIRASHLAEMGHVEIANRYCEAIGGTIRASTRGSQFYTPTFIGELKNLSDRLTAAPQMDKTASWISRKMAKPSLDTIGSWLEGRFSKLIVGEGDDGTEPPVTEETHPSKPTYGPFSHFSAISSATTSASPSPSPTPHATATASDMPFGHAHVHIDRASSAMDHLRSEVRRPSPVPRVASASATTTTFAQSFNPASRYRSTLGGVGGVPESEGSNGSEGQEISWWGSSSQDRSEPTPTAATFHKVDEAESGGNFVSLMDDYSPGITPIAPRPSQSKYQNHKDDGEEEDLGFGNSAFKKQNLDTGGSNEEPKKMNEQLKAAPSKSETKQQSSSWLGRWWNRSSEPVQSGPIKAKLGEETSFVYDKELKRWVNKKAGAADADPTPKPPPPSRPRTASPVPGGPPLKASDSGAPPQARPASAADMTLPPRRPPRVRSNLVPTDGSTAPGSAPPSAISFENPRSETGLTPPPGGVGIGRPKSSASKRNVRSRYVDVFQQQSQS